eukprot:1621678-Pyramimonas_sp.AAC.1
MGLFAASVFVPYSPVQIWPGTGPCLHAIPCSRPPWLTPACRQRTAAPTGWRRVPQNSARRVAEYPGPRRVWMPRKPLR